MNPLDNLPQVRKVLYAVQWVVNGVLTLAGIVFATQGTDLDALPQWYVLALAIAPALWTYLGITAQTNVTDADTPPKEQYGALDWVAAVAVTALVLVVLFLLGVLDRVN